MRPRSQKPRSGERTQPTAQAVGERKRNGTSPEGTKDKGMLNRNNAPSSTVDNSLFGKTLPVKYLESILCGLPFRPHSAKHNKINILQTSIPNLIPAHANPNPFFPKTLPVKYLESRLCQTRPDQESPNLRYFKTLPTLVRKNSPSLLPLIKPTSRRIVN